MTITTMRKLDRFIGIPCCWALGMFLLLLPRRQGDPLKKEIKKILIIKFFGLGSILLSTPSLQLLKEQFPGARISYLSFSPHREFLERLPLIDDVLTINPSSLTDFISQTLTLIRHLRTVKYDVVFDFEFFSKYSTFLNGLSKANVRVGFELPTRWRSMILTHQIPLSKDRHVIEAFCHQVFLLTGVGCIPRVAIPTITAHDQVSLAKSVPLPGGHAICINVNAGETFLERRWMPENFAELVSRLSHQADTQFYFIGSESERTYVEHVINLTSCPAQCYNVAGKLTIPELFALLHQSELLISNDSGPLHFASALGIPAIGLYGPETPLFYGPAGEHLHTIYKSISCSPCMNVYDSKTFKCPYDARCMREIEVDEVEQILESLSVSP